MSYRVTLRDEQGGCDKTGPKEQSGEPNFVQSGYSLMNRGFLHIKTLEFVFRITQDLKP